MPSWNWYEISGCNKEFVRWKVLMKKLDTYNFGLHIVWSYVYSKKGKGHYEFWARRRFEDNQNYFYARDVLNLHSLSPLPVLSYIFYFVRLKQWKDFSVYEERSLIDSDKIYFYVVCICTMVCSLRSVSLHIT